MRSVYKTPAYKPPPPECISPSKKVCKFILAHFQVNINCTSKFYVIFKHKQECFISIYKLEVQPRVLDADI